MTIDLDTLQLDFGGHSSRDNGVCLLEAAAWDAAWAVARDALAPTVRLLRQSAISLFAALIAGEWELAP